MKTWQEYRTHFETECVVSSGQLREWERLGTDGWDDPILQNQIRRTRARLRNAERALVRLAEGRFGICPECGQSIPPERLELMSSAEMCCACQEQLERATVRRAQLAATSWAYR